MPKGKAGQAKNAKTAKTKDRATAPQKAKSGRPAVEKPKKRAAERISAEAPDAAVKSAKVKGAAKDAGGKAAKSAKNLKNADSGKGGKGSKKSAAAGLWRPRSRAWRPATCGGGGETAGRAGRGEVAAEHLDRVMSEAGSRPGRVRRPPGGSRRGGGSRGG